MLRWRIIGVWWLCAGVLVGGAWLVSRGGTGAEAEAVSLGLDPAGVGSLRTERGGDAVTLERARGTPWRWVVRSAEGAWAADEARVRAGLRLLASASLEGREGEDAPGEDGTRVAIDSEAGRVELLMAGEALGGVTEGTLRRDGMNAQVWVARDVSLALRPGSLLAWRDGAVLRGLGGGAGRVSVRVGAGGLVLERTARGWALREPVRIAAEGDAVESLLGSLRGLRASGFVDSTDDSGGVALARVVVRTSLGVSTSGAASGERSDEVVQTLDLSRSAGAASVRGDVRWEGGGETLSAAVLIDPGLLNAVVADPRAYIRRRAVDVSTSDVRAIVVGDWRGVRSAEGWRVGERAARADETRGIEAVLSVLTGAAGRVELLDVLPDGSREIVAEGLSGAVIARCWVSSTAGGIAVARTAPSGSGERVVLWDVATDQGAAIEAWLDDRE